jgi:hypothetical protein
MKFYSEHSDNIFEINSQYDLHMDYIDPEVEQSKFFIIENFFKTPDLVAEYIETLPSVVWKEDARPSFNTIYFYDLKKYILEDTRLVPIYELLSGLSGLEPENYDCAVVNLFKFNSHIFNNFYRNYWSPHVDFGGYTGLVYLNKDDNYNGTNIYRSIDPNFVTMEPEHHKPWVSKEKYELLMTVPPVYNRLFFFNGSKYDHGMNIYDNRYTRSEYRTNLVFNMNTKNYPCD